MNNSIIKQASPLTKANTLVGAFMLLFILLSFTMPWKELYRFVFFLAVTPLTLYASVASLKRRVSIDTDALLILMLIFYIAAISWLSPSETSDNLQQTRWAITTAIFVQAVIIASRVWRENALLYGRILAAIVMIICIVALLKYYFEGSYPQRLSGYGFLEHPIVGPAALACLWGSALCLLLKGKRWSALDLALTLTSLTLLMAVIILSQSRGPFLSIAVYLSILTILIVIRRPKLGATAWAATLISITLIAFAFAHQITELKERTVDRGSSHRVTILVTTLQNPPENLLIGIGGGGNFTESPAGKTLGEDFKLTIEHPHNMLLSTYYYSGLPALLFLLILIYRVARKIAESSSTVPRTAGLSLLLLSVLLNTTDGHRLVGPPAGDWFYFCFPLAFLIGFSQPHLPRASGTPRQTDKAQQQDYPRL